MTHGRRDDSRGDGAASLRWRPSGPWGQAEVRAKGRKGPAGLAVAGLLPALGLPLVLSLALPLAGCGEAPDTSSETETLRGSVPSSASRRDSRPDAVEARRLLGLGRADLARPLVEGLVETLPVEGPLLMARLTYLEGDQGAWLPLIERGRAEDPRDPRPYAAAAEIYAAMDRRLAAKEEIERGIEAVGAQTPELQRAIGILRIVTPGMGKAGLDTLETARRADNYLPFMERPLGQAYFLSAKRALAEGSGALALERIRTSLDFDPEDPDALEFYGRVVISEEKNFEEGLGVLEDLFARGAPIGPELGKFQWSAGLVAQLKNDFTSARKHYLRARALGEPRVNEGTSRDFLDGQSDACFERAVERTLGGDDEGARVALLEGVALRPDELGGRRTFATRFAERAEVALGEGREADAVRLLSAGMHMDRDAPAVAHVSASLYFEKAFAAAEKGDAAGALEFASQATRYAPNDSMMWLFLGDLQYATKDYRGGAGSLERAVALAKAEGESTELATGLKLADCLHRTERTEDAIRVLERAITVAEAATAEEAAGQPLGQARAFLRELRKAD